MASSPLGRNPAPPRRVETGAPQNLTTRATDGIRQSIVDAEFKLGEALSESRLAVRLGVSRTPVREALTTLQRQGLIVIRPQSGSFVFMPMEASHEADSAPGYARADAAFHESIVENSANRYLIESYTLASGRVSALRSRNQSVSTPLRRRSNTAHRAIVAAFEKGRPAQSRAVDRRACLADGDRIPSAAAR